MTHRGFTVSNKVGRDWRSITHRERSPEQESGGPPLRKGYREGLCE
jgi:hypothetical protein